jgi:AsmA family protein
MGFNVRASGGDLADLYYLTHLALPNTPPFELSAHIDRNVKQVRVTQLTGKVGKSDLRGELTVDASLKRPTIKGSLISEQLRLKDLAASLGGKPTTPGTLQGASEPAKPSRRGAQQAPPSANARVFPTAHLQVERVRAMDADVTFSAQSIEAGTLPLKKVAFHVKLDDGALALEPFEFEMPQGQVRGVAHIDARAKTPRTQIDLRMSNIQLDQLKGKAPDAQPPLGGVMQARATLTGRGASLHDVMADADGRASVILPHGEVRAAFAELTGINVAKGLGLLLTGDADRADVRCGVAQFNVKDGVMHADRVVFDTENVRITGRGEVRLGPEELDLEIKGEPKKLRLARVRTPIEINGHLRKPSLGVDAGATLKQGAIATALGTVLTPLAAIIAFVDPGLAKDENCAALLASAEEKR